MINTSNFGAIMGAPVLGPDDEKIGTVGQVFVDPSSGRANWMTVHTGWFGLSESFVPLDTAEWDRESVHIRYGKDFIKDAPRIDTDGALSHSEEDELYRYYGMSHDEDGDRDAGIGSDDPSGGSPSAHMDTEGGPNSDRPTGSDYGHTGTGRMGAHAADVEPDLEGQGSAGTDAGERPRTRMRRFVVTETYVEEDIPDSEYDIDASEPNAEEQPGDR
jgi:hypothetical protein